MSFSPYQVVMASGSWDKTLRLWDVFENKGAIEKLVHTSDGVCVCVCVCVRACVCVTVSFRFFHKGEKGLFEYSWGVSPPLGGSGYMCVCRVCSYVVLCVCSCVCFICVVCVFMCGIYVCVFSYVAYVCVCIHIV